MARPLKNNCDYFPHDRDMRDHRKVKAIRSKFGITGYAIWVMTLEHLTGSDGNVFEYSDLEFELMAGSFGVSATEIRDLVDYCIKIELLFNKSGWVNSDSLDERLSPVYDKRGKAKELSKKQHRHNGKFTGNNSGKSGISVTETPQSKVKEIKGNKREIETFGTPSQKFFTVQAKYVDQNPCRVYPDGFRQYCDKHLLGAWFSREYMVELFWKQYGEGKMFKEHTHVNNTMIAINNSTNG